MQRIAQAVDRYTPFTPAELAALKQAGHTAVVAYLGRKTRGYTKAVTPEDLKNYVDSGMKVIFNFEGASTKRGYFTVQDGSRDAQDVLIEFEWLGVQPDPEVVCYYSVDYDAYLPEDFTAVDAYMLAVEHTQYGRFGFGPYGGFPIIEYLFSPQALSKPTKAWQTVAWSDNKISPHAAMYQDKIDIWIAGSQVDDDVIYSDPGWYPRIGGGNVDKKTAYLNGQPVEAGIEGGEWWLNWSALEKLPGFELTRDAQGVPHFTVEAPAPSAPTIASADIRLSDGTTTILKP
ncbi:glycoside hydrolase domain-containing protein [Alicyclobacillus sp. ALC3]|uniref:glycoside hydrolase domain-containing protein n=1 Tax=Alicyclobacillus sp. ALC3 TaxID=2796143 RepID=UPI002377EF9F|nr:glycoside hydrolase domain-containing protein [Alicyclobacillus sp. ALC3]WDL98113.1 DUF1906 domain-containing protein [Alicyclobacillus sp. ALC3]